MMTNFEPYPRRIAKSTEGDVGKSSYSFGAYDAPNETQGLDMKTFQSSVFDMTPVEERPITPQSAVSNTYRCSSAVPPSDPSRTTKKRVDNVISNNDIFGPPIPQVRSFPIGPEWNSSTVFETKKLEVEKPKEQKRIERSKTHSDAFRNGSYLITKDEKTHEPRNTKTFQSSNGLKFSETNYPERAPRKMRTCTKQKDTEMGKIMRGHPAEPFNTVVNNKRSSNTFDSQILGSTSRISEPVSNHRRTGVSYSSFQTGGCTLTQNDKQDHKVYSSGTTSMSELKPRQSIMKHPKTSINYTENFSNNSIDNNRPISRARSRITQSSVFAHLTEPTPNLAKKGYGRITESSIF